MFQDPAACVLEYLPYEQVAIGYGGKGLSVGGGGPLMFSSSFGKFFVSRAE